MPWGSDWRYGETNFPWSYPGVTPPLLKDWWESSAMVPGYINRMQQTYAGGAPEITKDWLTRRLWNAYNIWQAQGGGEQAGAVPAGNRRPLGDVLEAYITGRNAPWTGGTPGGGGGLYGPTPRDYTRQVLRDVTSLPLRSGLGANAFLGMMNEPGQAGESVALVGEAAGLPSWMRDQLERNASALRAQFVGEAEQGAPGDTFLDWLMRRIRM